MKIKKILFYILLLLAITTILSAKKTKHNKPDWIQNPSINHPNQLFLTSVGDGSTKREAEANAQAGLSRIFESKISVENTFKERFKEVTSSKETSSESETEMNKQVRIDSEQTLFNINFAEYYTDKLGMVYVLAYIDRFKTADIYEEKIQKINDSIKFYLSKNEQETDLIEKYSILNIASLLSLKNEILLEQLSIISSDTKNMISLDYSHDEIISQLQKVAKKISFSVSIKNDNLGKVGKNIESYLSKEGFTISKNAVLSITGEISFDKVELNRDQKFIRWTLSLNLENQNGVSLLTIFEKGREGHISYEEAQERCYRTINKKILTDFNRKLTEFFDRNALKMR